MLWTIFGGGERPAVRLCNIAAFFIRAGLGSLSAGSGIVSSGL